MEVLQANVTVAAAVGTTVQEIGEVPTREAEGTFNVERIEITAPSAVTGNGTNSTTINVRQMRAGAAIATLGSLALVAGVNLVAEVPTALALTGAPTVLAGDVIDAQFVQIGTGLALPAGTNIAVEID
jgi:hypothetical protein